MINWKRVYYKLNPKINQMFRNASRLLSMLLQAAPIAAKRLLIPASLVALHRQTIFSRSLLCLEPETSLHKTISLIESNIIRIEKNGEFVGFAFCFDNNLLVSASYQLQEKAVNQRHNYQFYQGQNKISGTFVILGHFENLTFIQHNQSAILKPLPGISQKEPFQFAQVQIYLSKQYPSIGHGYFVAQDSGYGIADGRGEIGSLIIKNNKIAGIVTQIGRDTEAGFLRFLQWKNFKQIVKNLKGQKIHLGVSAQAVPDREGISIVRIAPNSPFKYELIMGDFIRKVNGQKIRSVEAFQRLCLLEEGQLTLQILRQGIPYYAKVTIS